ncbi:MAG: hypothetical protein JZD40_03745 [Sulfolobus sp.]|nr:hypothetical protein [Sulfolobus sp.]
MKVLLISIMRELKKEQKEIYPLDTSTYQPSLVKRLAENPIIAQNEALISEGHEVKTIIMATTTLSSLVNEDVKDLYDLQEKIASIIRSAFSENFPLYIIPSNGSSISKDDIEHMHIGGPGNTLYFMFHYLRKEINEFKPDMILIDLTSADQTLSSLVFKASYGAILDSFVLNDNASSITLILTTLINDKIYMISRDVYDSNELMLYNYFLREFRLVNVLRQDIQPLSVIGRSELNKVGTLLKLGLILLLLHEFSSFEPNKMYSPEDFLNLIYKNFKISKEDEGKRIVYDYGLEILEGAIYYTIGRDFLTKYNTNERSFSLNELRKLLRFFPISVRNVIEAKFKDIEELVNLLRMHGIDEVETTLYGLRKVGSMTAVEFHKPNAKEIIASLLEGKKICKGFYPEKFLSELGLLDKIIEVKIKKDDIRINYIQECLDNVYNIIKEYLPT